MRIVKGIIDFVMDILETVAFIGSLFIVVYLFILTPNKVRGASMEPTFKSDDYIMTSRITYRFRRPERGDVVVFKAPNKPEVEYIKRIIGLPGDKIVVENGNVFVNDQMLAEKYTSAPTNLWGAGYIKEGVTITVPEDYVFVMGDNRPRSSDSREFGPVPLDSIIGQVFYRYYPVTEVGPIANPLPSTLR